MVMLYMVSAEHPVHESDLKRSLKNLLQSRISSANLDVSLCRELLPAFLTPAASVTSLEKINKDKCKDLWWSVQQANTRSRAHSTTCGFATDPVHAVFFSMWQSCTCDDMSSSVFSEALRTTSSETDGFRGKADSFLWYFMQ